MRLSFDVGGTFTDVVLVDEERRRTYQGKSLTTHDDLAQAITDAIRFVLDEASTDVGSVSNAVIGATTLVTNALIERRGGPAALITTRGFADVLEIGREWRYDLYDLRLEFPTPLVPAELRFEVTERVRADGQVETALDESELHGVHVALRDAGVSAVAICLLNSYQNGEHERRAAEILSTLNPGLSITTSSELVPEIREYERTTTTVANSYVRPVAGEHLSHVGDALHGMGIRQDLFVMQSNGGVTDTALASKYPIRLLESGPAAGALGAAYWGRKLGIEKLLAFDMGGTTAKVCLIEGGEPTLARSFEVARVQRFKRGSGMTLNVPVIDLLEIGAGGGSIAHIDAFGLLKVGPESAGAEPGPACYGRGGRKPTVTDADLLLGYLDADSFLGGRMTLDRDAAESAVLGELGAAFGGSVDDAAIGIVKVVEESMALATRIHATEKGRDPGGYTLFAFGGAAPMHAARVARALNITEIVIPASAGVLAASGLQVAKPSVSLGRTRLMTLSDWDEGAVREIYDDLRRRAHADLAVFARGGDIAWRHSADMRFRGQGFELEVVLPAEPTRKEVAARFDETYAKVYGAVPGNAEAQVVSWRLIATVDWPDIAPPADSEPKGGERKWAAGEGSVWFPELGRVLAPRYHHRALANGSVVDGPAIIQQIESTVVVGPGDQARIDEFGHVHLSVAHAERRLHGV